MNLCETCDFFDGQIIEDVKTVGYCRRYPPTYVVSKEEEADSDEVTCELPTVDPKKDWCGEWNDKWFKWL